MVLYTEGVCSTAGLYCTPPVCRRVCEMHTKKQIVQGNTPKNAKTVRERIYTYYNSQTPLDEKGERPISFRSLRVEKAFVPSEQREHGPSRLRFRDLIFLVVTRRGKRA